MTTVAESRFRHAPLVVLAIVLPWVVPLLALIGQTAGVRLGVYDASIPLIAGIAAAPAIAGVMRRWIGWSARLALAIGIGSLVGGALSGMFYANVSPECLRVPLVLYALVGAIPGALWFAGDAVAVAKLTGERGRWRAVLAVACGLLVSIPLLLAAIALFNQPFLQDLLLNRGDVECFHIL